MITGDEEARLSFLGATRGVPDAVDPVLVTDIGGGSTEVILGRGGTPVSAVSLDIGSVRLTERFLAADPPTPDQVAAATRYIDDLLDIVPADVSTARTWIGVAGTTTTLAAIARDLPAYQRSVVHGSRTDLDTVRAVAGRLRTTPVAELRTIGSLQPRRADVIGAGALIVERISRRVSVDALVVSESDILDGIALDMIG